MILGAGVQGRSWAMAFNIALQVGAGGRFRRAHLDRRDGTGVRRRCGPTCSTCAATSWTGWNRDCFRGNGTDRSRLSAVTERTLVLIKPDGVARAIRRRDPRPCRAQGAVHRSSRAARPRTRRSPPPTTPSTRASPSTRDCWSSSPPDRWSRRCSRARGRSRRSGSSPAAPTRSRRPSRAPSAPTSRSTAQQNLVHGSDSVESAEREIALWFPHLARG